MATQQTAPAAPPPPAATGSTPSAQVVGNAFVHQYYHILHQSPEFVYRFYLEGSKLGRPDTQGGMSSVTGMEAINEKILSLDYSEIRAEIKTVDAHESLEGGVIVLVTGYLTGKDDVRRNFTQSFFLATQDKGYYVLNDIFRYVEDADPLAAIQVPVITPEQETPPPQEQQISERLVPETEQEDDDEVDEEDDEVIDEELFNPSDHEETLEEDEEIPVEEVIDEVEVPNSSPPLPPVKAEPNLVAAVPEEQPKKSYASIVKVKNVSPPVAPAPAPVRSAPVKPVSQVVPAPVPAPTPEAPAASSNSTETSSIQEAEADSHSVYIKNLPLSATPAQLEEEFKKFGSIKTNGIQVRSHKQQGFCFGFVEFEDASSVQTAIEDKSKNGAGDGETKVGQQVVEHGEQSLLRSSEACDMRSYLPVVADSEALPEDTEVPFQPNLDLWVGADEPFADVNWIDSYYTDNESPDCPMDKYQLVGM